jgi:hypothetical protein
MSHAALDYVAGLHDVKGSMRAVLWAMAYRANKDTGLYTAGVRRLANESGLGHSQAANLVKRAVADKLISEVLDTAGSRPAYYRLPPFADSDPVVSTPERTQTEDAEPGADGFVSTPGEFVSTFRPVVSTPERTKPENPENHAAEPPPSPQAAPAPPPPALRTLMSTIGARPPNGERRTPAEEQKARDDQLARLEAWMREHPEPQPDSEPCMDCPTEATG